MGNLPNSRTVTANPSDPVSSALADEVQDCIIGTKRKLWWRTFYPKFLVPGSSVAEVILVGAQLGIQYRTTAATTITFDIPFEDGDRIAGLRYWAAGNGTVDLTSAVLSYTAAAPGNAAAIAQWSDSNRSSTFAVVDVTSIATGPTFTPTTLAISGTLLVTLTVNATGYLFGPFSAGFDRL